MLYSLNINRISSTLLFSFAGIEATSAHLSVMQTAFPLTSILSLTSRLSYLLLFSLTHTTRFSSFGVKLYYICMFFLTHYLVIANRNSLVKKQI